MLEKSSRIVVKIIPLQVLLNLPLFAIFVGAAMRKHQSRLNEEAI
jgi:hypothetical protein